MTTEKLIINGVDHSVFYLEWAKRGGVFVIKPKYMEINDETMRDYDFFYTFCAGKVVCINDYDVMGLEDGSTYVGIIDSIKNDEYLEVRMATPSECAKEGVEYIEPPMIWREIESVPYRTAVLVKVTGCNPIVAAYDPDFDEWYDPELESDFGIFPTHWMPLPQPPKDE